MSPCQKLPPFLRNSLPGTLVCALVGALLAAVPARAQSVRPVSSPRAAVVEPASPPPPPSAVRSRGPSAVEPQVRVPAPSDAGELFLARAFQEPRESEGEGPDLESLRDFLPPRLYADVVELKNRVIRVRHRLFGREGIVSVGRADDGGEVGRLRLNLQYDPDPGVRVTIVTG